MPFDRWLFTVDRAVGQSRSLAIAPISRGRFVGYSPSEKASPHSAAGVDAGTTRSSRSPDPSNSPPDNAHTVLNDEKCRPQIIEGSPGRPATKLLATLPGPDESPSLKHRPVAARKSGRVLNGREPAPELRL